MLKSSVMTAIVFSSLFLFAAEDPNMMVPGLYKYENSSTGTRGDNVETSSKTTTDGNHTMTMKGKGSDSARTFSASQKPTQICIKKDGQATMPQQANCKATAPERTATSTKVTSVCPNMSVTVEHRKIKTDVYEQKSKIEMTINGAKHMATNSTTIWTRVGDCK